MGDDALDKVEALVEGLSNLLENFSKEVRSITQEVTTGGRHRPVDELLQRIRTLQEEMYRDALEKYGDLLGASVEIERELVAKITRLRDVKERAGTLKEIIATTVKPGDGS
ncbi:MAG: hypothetical protein ACE5G5_01785 [Candidatus Methylomirabilales bacterium]